MPSSRQIYAAAKLDKDAYNNLLRSIHISHWDKDDEEGFAVRVGLYAAFKAVGFNAEAAADYADTLASREKLPMWFVSNPLDKEEAFFSQESFGFSTIESLRSIVAGGAGRQVIGDGAPDLELDTPEPADTLTVINLHSVRDRMLALFAN